MSEKVQQDKNSIIMRVKIALQIFLTSLSGFSPLKKDKTTPVKTMAPRAPARPIPAHKSHPFCRLNGSFKSDNIN